MKVNAQMTKEAEAYAKELASRGAFEHSQGGKDGENLAMGCSSKKGEGMTAAQATRNWYVKCIRFVNIRAISHLSIKRERPFIIAQFF